MKILNLGSLNFDRVYSVQEFVKPGETIAVNNFETFCGGKGLNQSIAIAKAGAPVYHAGIVGVDGNSLLAALREHNVNLDFIITDSIDSGHTIIQVNPAGQNAIIVYSGANYKVTSEFIDDVLSHFSPGDILLLQNEISHVDYAIRRGHEMGMRVVFNPSPITDQLLTYPLDLVDIFILNEHEGERLTGKGAFDDILDALRIKYPRADVVLTVGKEGVYYDDGKKRLHHGIYDVAVVDTTAAGDTFSGYFIAGLYRQIPAEQILELASIASSIAVSRNGASDSIPKAWELKRFNDFWKGTEK